MIARRVLIVDDDDVFEIAGMSLELLKADARTEQISRILGWSS